LGVQKLFYMFAGPDQPGTIQNSGPGLNPPDFLTRHQGSHMQN